MVSYQQDRPLMYKTHPISEDYSISEKVLGQGISGSVVQVHDMKTLTVYALKVSLIMPKIFNLS